MAQFSLSALRSAVRETKDSSYTVTLIDPKTNEKAGIKTKGIPADRSKDALREHIRSQKDALAVALPAEQHTESLSGKPGGKISPSVALGFVDSALGIQDDASEPTNRVAKLLETANGQHS